MLWSIYVPPGEANLARLQEKIRECQAENDILNGGDFNAKNELWWTEDEEKGKNGRREMRGQALANILQRTGLQVLNLEQRTTKAGSCLDLLIGSGRFAAAVGARRGIYGRKSSGDSIFGTHYGVAMQMPTIAAIKQKTEENTEKDQMVILWEEPEIYIPILEEALRKVGFTEDERNWPRRPKDIRTMIGCAFRIAQEKQPMVRRKRLRKKVAKGVTEDELAEREDEQLRERLRETNLKEKPGEIFRIVREIRGEYSAMGNYRGKRCPQEMVQAIADYVSSGRRAVQTNRPMRLKRWTRGKKGTSVSEAEIRAAMLRLDPKTTPGKTGVRPKGVRMAAGSPLAVKVIKHLAERCFHDGVLPWKRIKALAIPKGGTGQETTEASNFRPLGKPEVIEKVVVRVLCGKLRAELLDKEEYDKDFAYRTARSAEQAITIALQIYQECLVGGWHCAIVSLDLGGCFYCICREELQTELIRSRCFGIHHTMCV